MMKIIKHHHQTSIISPIFLDTNTHIQKEGTLKCTLLISLLTRNDYSSNPLGLFFCQFQLSRHISSIPNCAFQPSSASALAGLQ